MRIERWFFCFQYKYRYVGLVTALLVLCCLGALQKLSDVTELPPNTTVLSDNSRDLHRKTFGEIDAEVAKPFEVGISIGSPHLYPDLRRQADFRATHLAYFNGRAYPSRKVFYHTTADVRGVLVLPLNAQMPSKYLQLVLQERLEYCNLHHYGLYARYIQDFSATTKPKTEKLNLAALRMLSAALAAFPTAQWFCLLTHDIQLKNRAVPLIPLNPGYNLTTNLVPNLQTSGLKLQNLPTNASETDLLLTTNAVTGQVSARSMLVSNTLTARTFLSIATDPLMQEYRPFVLGFDHAESVLTHLVKWHPKLLSRTGMLPSPHMGISTCSDEHTSLLACERVLASV